MLALFNNWGTVRIVLFFLAEIATMITLTTLLWPFVSYENLESDPRNRRDQPLSRRSRVAMAVFLITIVSLLVFVTFNGKPLIGEWR